MFNSTWVEAVDGTRDVCVNCGGNILFKETSIDDFWYHVGAAGFCDPTSNWLDAKEWATPRSYIVKYYKKEERYSYARYTWWDRLKLRWWMLWNRGS